MAGRRYRGDCSLPHHLALTSFDLRVAVNLRGMGHDQATDSVPVVGAPPPARSAAWWREAGRDIIAGTVGGIAGRLIEYPFDTIKVRLQAALFNPSVRYVGAIDCFTTTLRKEGVRGLYRGLAAPLAGTIVETATLFFTNGVMKRFLSDRGHLAPGEELPLPLVLLAGGGTGFFVSFVLTPIELIKCRLQVADTTPGGIRYTGPIDCVRKSVQRDGLRVLYRGHVGTMLREVPGTAFWFGAYEAFARAMTPAGATRQDLSSATIITAGALGGMAYWLIMYPCDTVKSAMQIADAPINVAPLAASASQSAKFSTSSTAPSAPVQQAQAQSRFSTITTMLQRSRHNLQAALPGSALFRYLQRGVGADGSASSSATSGVTSHGVSSAQSVQPSRPAHFSTLSWLRNTSSASDAQAAAAATAAAHGRSNDVSGSCSKPATAKGASYHPSFSGTWASIYRAGGTRALYAGFVPTLLRAAPSNAAIFVFYEWTCNLVQPLVDNNV